MAVVRRLRVRGLRNLADVAIEPAGEVTWLVGPNGAGKTTLLEALYLLGRGRSFRGGRFGPLVMAGCTRAVVEARAELQSIESEFRWESTGTSDQEGRTAASGWLPVRLVCGATHALVEGEPGLRRRFVDWNLFHVEPGFVRLRTQFRRVAGQRNAWLRAGGRGVAAWDQPYAALLSRIATLRAGLFARVAAAFADVAEGYPELAGVSSHWQALGEDPQEGLDRLGSMREADVARGYTWLGPSRADFSFAVGRRRWVGSRGETKLVGTLLQVAADRAVKAETGVNTVWLIDDLAAELSPDLAVRLFHTLRAEGGQCLVTALPGSPLPVSQGEDDVVYYLERGELRLENG